MPKVLGLVSFRIFPTLMGGQKGVALFYLYLKEHINVFLAASIDNIDTMEISINKILYPNKKIYWNIFKIQQLKKLTLSQQIDLIIAEHSYTGWIAWLLHKATRKPFLIHSHNLEGNRFRQMHKWWWKIYDGYEGWIHRKAHHSFFISEEDRQLAIINFHLPSSRCSVVTYGIEKRNIEKNKISVKKMLAIDETKTLFLFNGTLDYKPNYDAVLNLIDKIDPLLQQRMNNYQIIITGNRAPGELVRKIQLCKNVFYAGFVSDVALYYQAADLFLNPVSNDTGVKTKLIEAIANNCSAISTESGAKGIVKEVCKEKLVIVSDNDWNFFVESILQNHSKPPVDTSQDFYDFYNWENITAKASEIIKGILENN